MIDEDLIINRLLEFLSSKEMLNIRKISFNIKCPLLAVSSDKIENYC